ncbi:MAG: prepilin-type N-terminal cleavage/methylation domain-containing protein [bacterium]|nr:prepilin-type N-terminal cleavage/methylation domain-containing protein [bacterium]
MRRLTHDLRNTGRQGFTLVELLVVIAVIIVVARFSYTTLVGDVGKQDLNATTQKMAALAREAQSLAMAQSSSTTWGVRFSNETSSAAYYALFAGTYYPSSSVRGYYRLPATVAYVSSSLTSGAVLDVYFSQITGRASPSATIRIYSLRDTSRSSTISISPSGAVSF